MRRLAERSGRPLSYSLIQMPAGDENAWRKSLAALSDAADDGLEIRAQVAPRDDIDPVTGALDRRGRRAVTGIAAGHDHVGPRGLICGPRPSRRVDRVAALRHGDR